ncbi:MAG TPA: peptidylprolyl isomerase [Terriglobales bacterium]|nr:peptidylprolyl isomerase [Terriglobales bacterium]
MRSLPSFGVAVLLACGAALGAQTKPAASPAQPAATDPVVISAGTEHIRASQFSALIKAAPAENQTAMLANKRAVADELGKMLALVAEAHRRGLDRDPGFQAQMMLARDNALAKSVVDKLQATAVPTPALIQAYYTAHASEFAQTKVRHILVGDNETQGGPAARTQAAALAKVAQVAAKLKAGADFATVAKADSDDPGSKDKGGELGEISPGQTVPEFEAAMNKLAIGQVSDPVHTRYGYHIIQVEARSTMPLDQAKPIIQDQLTSQAVNSAIDKIAAESHIVISDSYFGPAKPPAPTTPHP